MAARHRGSNREVVKLTSEPTALRVLVVGAGVGGISIARGLLRDGHDVTVYEQRPDARPGGGAVTIWSNGATVLEQLGVDMDGAGQLLSTVRVVTSTGRPLVTIDLTAIVDRLGAPVRMVRVESCLSGCSRAFRPIASDATPVRSRWSVRTTGYGSSSKTGAAAEGDVLIGADGLHSRVRDIVGAQPAEPTGWCSWQGLVTLPYIADKDVAVHDHRRARKPRPLAGGRLRRAVVVRLAVVARLRQTRTSDRHDPRPISRDGPTWSMEVLATLTDNDLAHSPYPHFRHPIPRSPARGSDVARRRRTHDAAHPRAGHQSGAARHDGVVQGAFGFPEQQAAPP